MPTIQNKRRLAKLFTAIILLISFSVLFSCKKLDLDQKPSSEIVTSANTTSASSGCDVTVCEDCSFQETIDNDTTEYATVLGGTYNNPYSIANMTQAYNNIHGTNLQSVGITHYYVRFKPQTEAQFKMLDSALDLELYDYPLNRVVIQDGDYWPEAYAGLGQNEYPWLYTVVESNFLFLDDIPYENLTPLNIPSDDATLEDEAFNITGNNECGVISEARIQSSKSKTSQTETGRDVVPNSFENCPPGYYWDNSQGQCLPIPPCPPGYYWHEGLLRCVRSSPPSTFLHPQGMITFRTYDDNGFIPYSAPLRYTRIVGRRFFKIDKTYTDANGNFEFSKRFPNKVTIIVKFRTSSVTIKKWPYVPVLYGLSQMKKNIGTYKGNDLRNLHYEFQKGSTSKKRKTRNWIACVALNTATETQGFLSTNNLIQLPNKFYIYFSQIWDQSQTPQYEFIRKSGVSGVPGQFGSIILEWTTTDINSITTSKATINIAQQLGLRYLISVNEASNDGINRYGGYWNSLEYVKQNNFPEEYSPFGNGVSNFSQDYYPNIVAMWQAFAQHFGHTIADRFFKWGEYNFVLQGKTWFSSGGISSSSKYLEGFDPSIGVPYDYFNWIPVGLINDLMDNQTDPFPINDNVSGFTYSEIQSVYYSELETMADFKNAFKSIRPSQSIAIDQLFASYGY